jgi:undecaprenyl phosphate N,N'-diacetylbacillosamine 1-phosphate transferase
LVKILFDFVVGLIVFVITLPVILVVALVLTIANRGTPFFTQVRPGLRGKPFRLVKFKTMNDLKDADGDLLSDEIRLTKVGKIVRETSLDELPQLFNVIKGDMSLVGPRPLLMEYLPLYNAEQMRRHDVKPGITGWAQINGRNALSWADKFRLDVWYVDNQSFFLDIKILFLTISKVFKREGISSATMVTMEKFRGNV